MRRGLRNALAGALFGAWACACGAPQTPPPAQAPQAGGAPTSLALPASIVPRASASGASADAGSDAPATPDPALANARRALTALGHACTMPDAATLVCDHEDATKPTLVVLAATNGKMTRLDFTTSFTWKSPAAGGSACDQSAAKLNALNRGSDLLKVVCTDEVLTWVAPVLVTRAGVTDDELAEFATWFSAAVQAVLHESELVPLLR